MANKMLIDAAHPEETRVVVTRGRRVEDFDFEAASRKPLRGNIYLAKVTRVEPSLQAAFVDYGGNRHGFLAFNEIHPDYYQIPHADRLALLKEEAAANAEGEETGDDEAGEANGPVANGADEAPHAETLADDDGVENGDEDANGADTDEDEGGRRGRRGEDVVSVGAEDALEEVPERRRRPPRRVYKIQEVIRRRQILLVQVVKEERGNKGAALTTYLSLAGRYSVLMPNTDRGGGISRKITDAAARKRLKAVVGELDVPEGMGIILRTAGASRTKSEIRRDFEYLLRLWENVRELTLKSIAPKLVYEEGSLIKRSIRDLYNKDIDEILVAGEAGYREAKDFMRMLMPSHARHVQQYKGTTPVFTHFGVEQQLDAMFSPQVTLPSGGYIVINPTEALVSIDVNSGRATREHNIEDTALRTNLEAAEEIARQLRLRDLAGLIVIDFIDMEEKKNNRAVERKLKDCLKFDRARIQVGRISHFGLLEMSRQRIRTGVVESSSEVCPHCAGSGYVRSTESVALHVLRALEDHLLKQADHHVLVRTTTPVALYILNQKRSHLNELEARFCLSIAIEADETLGAQHLAISEGDPVTRAPGEAAPITVIHSASVDPDAFAAAPEADSDERNEADEDVGEPSEQPKKRRRRRKRRASGEAAETSDVRESTDTGGDVEPATDQGETVEAGGDGRRGMESDADEDDGGQRGRRRRGRRGGRRHRRERETPAAVEAEAGGPAHTAADSGSDAGEAAPPEAAPMAEPHSVGPEEGSRREEPGPELIGEPAPTHGPVRRNGFDSDAESVPPSRSEETAAALLGDADIEEPAAAAPSEPSEASGEPRGGIPEAPGEPAAATPTADEPPMEPAAERVEGERAPQDPPAKDGREPEPVGAQPAEQEEEERPKRAGWWQRRSFF